MIKQLPISLHGGAKGEVRTQFAALPFRIKDDKVQVLLITSRGTGRWIVPKGWPMEGKTPAQSALQEAWEEAGVKGKPLSGSIGVFSYAKNNGEEDELPCLVMLYPVRVKSLSKKYPERGERRRVWMSRKKAAGRVAEPELARLIRDFDPRKAKPTP